jgi:hypothetical protein
MVEDSYYWYLANQEELVKKYDGKCLVLAEAVQWQGRMTRVEMPTCQELTTTD